MKVGLVLSGGGIRGIAHLGVLKALKKTGVQISQITGTSAGSIAGSLYAAGVDPEDAFNIFMQTKLMKFIRPALGSLGLINIERTGEIFKQYLPAHIEDLKIPMTICTTNFSEGTVAYFTKGPLVRAIHASSCIPGVFKPIMIHEQMYVDGGVLNNFPVEPLLNNCDYIIGSTCNNLKPVDKIVGITKLMQRAAIMSINHDMERKSRFCDLIIEPKGMGEINTFDTKKAETIYWLAYEEALKAIRSSESFKELLKAQAAT
ncbi:MAG: patatin-like phospholipase family protein [Pedobacter sp.]